MNRLRALLDAARPEYWLGLAFAIAFLIGLRQ